MNIQEFINKIKSLKENNTPIMYSEFKTYINLFNTLYLTNKELALTTVNDLINLNVFTEGRLDDEEYSYYFFQDYHLIKYMFLFLKFN